ncbi:MAG: hypothetical protein ACXVV5_24505 [Solirubrobacteraceae bacterium]
MAGVGLAVAAVPAGAQAAVRTGSVQDPQGDASALSGPALDLKSVAVSYDDVAGSIRVTWSYYNDVRADYPPGSWGANGNLSAAANGLPIDQVFVNWNGTKSIVDGTWNFQDSLSVSGVAGTLSGTPDVSQDGQVVTAEFTNPMLAGHNWRQGLASTGASTGDPYNQFWFDGYAPPPASVPTPAPTPPAASPGNGDGVTGPVGMTIDDGAQYTNDPDVTLSVIAPPGVGARFESPTTAASERLRPSPPAARSDGGSRNPVQNGFPRRSTCASATRR